MGTGRQERYLEARLGSRARVGEVAVGARREITARARSLVERARGQVETLVAGDEQFVIDFVSMLKAGAKERDRTCVQAILMILKLVGQENTLVIEWVKRTGASTEDELRRIVEAYKSAGEADTLTAIERMTTALEAMLPLHEEHRGMVVRRLGGYLPVMSDQFDGEHNHGA